MGRIGLGALVRRMGPGPSVRLRRVGTLTGIGLIASGLAVAAQPLWVYVETKLHGASLLKQAEAMGTSPLQPADGGPSGVAARGASVASPAAVPMTTTLPLASPGAGRLIGGIAIPALSITVPLLEGTDDAELNAGAGHLTGSAMPGEAGVSVIAAHNATWFRHLDALRPGAEVTVWTAGGRWVYQVTGSRVVRAGDQLMNTALPTLVLETCYPLDALYLTPERYLVSASLVRVERTGDRAGDTSRVSAPAPGAASGPAGAAPDATGSAAGAELPPADDPYRAAVPADLAREGLTLSANGLPMGHLRYTGHPSAAFIASERPLSAVNTLVQLTLAYVHASAEGKREDLQRLLAGAEIGNPLFGHSLGDLQYTGPFEVTLGVEGERLQSTAASVELTIAGQRWTLHVAASIDAHGVMRLGQLAWDAS
ncbi:class D sortase [Alicyclobacillus macrosporangiidus]|uniref:class D sortase n=1 Tax=Alicyclobacillus macrosporangiidus TaxID=392015 RepID=UPI000689DABF|nr:class D sortase [Alicyclobacillus macrosporangiidus]